MVRNKFPATWGRVGGLCRRSYNEKGAVLAFVAVSMIGLVGIAGLSLDSARLYVTRAQLSRAVDSAALGAAAALRLGEDTAEQRLYSMVAANGVEVGADGTSVDYEFGTNEEGENTVTVSASRMVPTTFMRVFGTEQVLVGSVAEATVPPLDITLVLDTSGSLGSAGAWDDLQNAAVDFLENFDDNIDQMGLVSFQIRGTDRHPLGAPFSAAIEAQILGMSSAGDTNTGEGLRLAREQLTGPQVRERSVRVVVFFTDGRPTAFRGIVGGEDRMMAVYTTTASGRMRGFFNDPDNLPTDSVANPSGCKNATSCGPWTEPTIRVEARDLGIQRADEIRNEGIYLFAIGLGNPASGDPILVPDNAYLRLLANQDGVANSGQPQGKYYFAPTPAELDDVFDAVAQDILVRLTQ